MKPWRFFSKDGTELTTSDAKQCIACGLHDEDPQPELTGEALFPVYVCRSVPEGMAYLRDGHVWVPIGGEPE